MGEGDITRGVLGRCDIVFGGEEGADYSTDVYIRQRRRRCEWVGVSLLCGSLVAIDI